MVSYYDIIHDIILFSLQPSNFLRHSGHSLPILFIAVGMTMAEKWISTRLVTLPIKVLCQTWTWKKML